MSDREMLLKCAKALFDLDQDKAYTQHVLNPIMYGISGKIEWNFITDEQKVIASIYNGYVGQVKAVIKAMREPTEEMKIAGSINPGSGGPDEGYETEVWQAMIDAIIGDK